MNSLELEQKLIQLGVAVTQLHPRVYHRRYSICTEWGYNVGTKKRLIDPWTAQAMGLSRCRKCSPTILGHLQNSWIARYGPIFRYPEDM